jgi:hypothetical protein
MRLVSAVILLLAMPETTDATLTKIEKTRILKLPPKVTKKAAPNTASN